MALFTSAFVISILYRFLLRGLASITATSAASVALAASSGSNHPKPVMVRSMDIAFSGILFRDYLSRGYPVNRTDYIAVIC
jgi:hypothetical protein